MKPTILLEGGCSMTDPLDVPFKDISKKKRFEGGIRAKDP